MSIKKTNDNRGSYRGAGAYSKNYASFDSYPGGAGYAAREIWQKVEGCGDYDSGDAVFTGEVSRKDSSTQQWPRLADRQNTRGDGAYSHEGRRSTERARRQSDGPPSGGQKVSD